MVWFINCVCFKDFVFSSFQVWEKVKAANPEMKMWDIGKLIGEQWRNLPEDERQVFFHF